MRVQRRNIGLRVLDIVLRRTGVRAYLQAVANPLRHFVIGARGITADVESADLHFVVVQRNAAVLQSNWPKSELVVKLRRRNYVRPHAQRRVKLRSRRSGNDSTTGNGNTRGVKALPT